MMRRLWAAGLVAPLLLVAALAGILGFFATRQLAGPEKRPAQLSVVPLPATPTPSPSPSPTPGSDETSGRRPRTPRSSRCPAGCDCSFPPPNGIVIVCHGR
jgi:hypothetical protein